MGAGELGASGVSSEAAARGTGVGATATGAEAAGSGAGATGLAETAGAGEATGAGALGAAPITYTTLRGPNTDATTGLTAASESARPSILIAKPEPAGNATVSTSPSSLFARELCRSAPREGWAAVTRCTTSAHRRWSSPASAAAAGADDAGSAATAGVGAEGADGAGAAGTEGAGAAGATGAAAGATDGSGAAGDEAAGAAGAG